MRIVLFLVLLASCSKGGDDGEGSGAPFVPPEAGVRRLLAPQYLNTVRYLFGPEAAEAAEPMLPEDFATEGFIAVGAGSIPPSGAAAAQYSMAAAAVAEAVACDVRDHRSGARLAELVPCAGEPNPSGGGCYLELAQTLLPLVYRRPVTEDEVVWLRGVAFGGEMLGTPDFYRGLRYALLAMLQSPSFLYLVEVGEPDPDEPRRRLSPYELASRMAFFLTDTTPDAELLAAASDGSLAQAGVRRAQASRLLDSPAARETIQRRFAEFLELDELEGSVKDPASYPEFDEMLRDAMREEVERVIADVVLDRDVDARTVLFGDETIANDRLAELYGIGNAPAPGLWEPRSLPENRAGFLTSGAFLASKSQGIRTSPSQRGSFIKRRLLCEAVEPHGPEVPDALPDLIDGAQTTREAIEDATADDLCENCHRAFDPFGFALEGFDAIGRERDSEGGRPIDSSASVAGFGDFEGGRGLARRMLEGPEERASFCLMLNVFRGGLGRLETDGEMSALTELYEAFRDSGFRLKPLLVEIVDSPSFLFVAEIGDE